MVICISNLSTSHDIISDDGTVSSANVIGCRRRTGRNGRTPRFRCDGTRGPPCTVKRGDTVYLDVDFTAGEVSGKEFTKSSFRSEKHKGLT